MIARQFHLDVETSDKSEEQPSRWQIAPEAANTGFREGASYRISKPGAEWELVIDDQTIDCDANHWLWSPGFYAGQVRAELLTPHKTVAAYYTLDVSPHPDKLGKEVFQAMLDEIWSFDPSLVIGTEPAQTPIGHQANISDPWLEYARLRTYGKQFARALEHIAQQPIRELKAQRLQVPLQYVRRADRQTALAALRNPHVVAALGHGDSSAALAKTLPLFDVPVTRQTLDSAANRCIAAIARAVARRAIRLRSTLKAIVEKESLSNTRSDLASRWLRRKTLLDALIGQLRHAQSISPISDATRAELSAAGLNAVSADPKYARAYRVGWRILRHGIEGPPDTEKLWISPTWEIYERWCFVRLCIALQTRLPEYDWTVNRKCPSNANASLSGTGADNTQIELLLQPKFPAYDQNSKSGFQSISGMREPDIVITFQTKDELRWVVLDAKYRTTRANVLDAMSSAHIYRDALRLNDQKPSAALLLVPRSGGAPWLENEIFIKKHAVGVWSLDHGSDVDQLLNQIWQSNSPRES